MHRPHRIVWSWYSGRWWVDCHVWHSEEPGGDWAGPYPAEAPPCCTKCSSPPINGQCTNHRQGRRHGYKVCTAKWSRRRRRWGECRSHENGGAVGESGPRTQTDSPITVAMDAARTTTLPIAPPGQAHHDFVNNTFFRSQQRCNTLHRLSAR